MSNVAKTGRIAMIEVAVMDALEQRRMLSASLSKGTLTITGTDNADVITVHRDRARGKNLAVDDNGVVSNFKASAVKRIVMNGGAGDDDLSILDDNGKVRGRHVEHGDDGNDTLNGDDANDSLNGDAGDDSLLGNGGNDSLDGGDGDDDVEGGDGNDRCSGDLGDDSLNGGAGHDHVAGGEGQDHFHGNDDKGKEIEDESGDDLNDDNGGGGGGTNSGKGKSKSDELLVSQIKVAKNVFAT